MKPGTEWNLHAVHVLKQPVDECLMFYSQSVNVHFQAPDFTELVSSSLTWCSWRRWWPRLTWGTCTPLSTPSPPSSSPPTPRQSGMPGPSQLTGDTSGEMMVTWIGTPFLSGSWSTSQGWWSGGNLAVIASLSFSVWVQYTDCFSGSQWRQWLSTSSRHLTQRVGDIINSIQTTGLMLTRTIWRDLSSKGFPEAINLPRSGTPS